MVAEWQLIEKLQLQPIGPSLHSPSSSITTKPPSMSSKRTRDEPTDGDGGERTKKPRHGFRVGPENLPDGPWRRKGTPPSHPTPPQVNPTNPPPVTKIKHNLITKAKVKKQYAKIKIKAQRADTTTPALPIPADELEATTTTTPDAPNPDAPTPPPQVHPARQAILNDDATATSRPAREPRGPRAPTQKAKDGDNSNLTELGPRVPTADRPETEDSAAADGEPSSQSKERRPHHRHNRPDYFAKQLAAGEKRKAEVEARIAEAARREAEMARRVAERERQRRAMEKANTPGRDGKRKLGRQGNVLLDQVKRIVERS